MDNAQPSLSVVLVVGPRRSDANRMLAALSAQTARAEIDVVVVDTAPAGTAPIATPADLRVTVIEHRDARSYARARIAGLGPARGPIIAFLEDHCFPQSGWAAALIEAHREPWAAVSYRIVNANPETYFGRAGMLADFGPFTDTEGRRETRYLVSNNVSYKRAVLHAYADRLPMLLAPDQVFFEVLARDGHRQCVDGSAVAAHWNINRPLAMAHSTLAFSRLHAANRASLNEWSAGKRLVYGLVVPLASLPLRGRSLLQAVAQSPRLVPDVVAALPMVVTSFVASGVGAALGYLGGPGDAEATVAFFELGDVRGTQ